MRGGPRSKSPVSCALAMAMLSVLVLHLVAQQPGDPPLQLRSGALVSVPRDLGANEYYQGIPWTGETGITESVAEIMAREDAAPLAAGPLREPYGGHAEGERRARRENPSAPAVAQWPAPPPGAQMPADDTTPPRFTYPSPFNAILSTEAGVFPPDTNGAVGPTQVMVVANGRFKLFDKTGTLLGLNVTDATFFASVRGGFGVAHPHVRYDRLSGRWFISEINTAPTSNRILLAVSSGSTITDASSFTFFQFQHDLVGTTPNIDTGRFADYATLGVDAHALYLGVNVMNGSAFANSTGYVVNKANLIGGTLTVTAFRGLAIGPAGNGAGPFSPQGVDNDDAAATQGYFIGNDNAFFSRLAVRRVTTPGATPAISGDLVVTVPTTSFPIDQVAAGSTLPLDAVDDRLFAAMIRKNTITGVSSLWTAHNIAVNPSGVGVSFGADRRNGARWYQLDNLTTTPTLTQSGTYFDSAATNPHGYWIPSIAANGQGSAFMGMSSAGVMRLPAEEGAARVAGDAAGTFSHSITRFGTSSYDAETSGTRQRWGAYSQVVIDPTDNQTFWSFQEYVTQQNRWTVNVTRVLPPGPAIPTAANPPSVGRGAMSAIVTVTGSTPFREGFYDPGAGFPNHIAGMVSGTGVTVNSVTFSNRTTVVLNVSVATSAALGFRDVIITNPDGQSATGADILSVSSGFTDDALTLGTIVRAVHITELRTRVNGVRVARGLGAFTFTDPTLTPGSTTIRVPHVAELRTALDGAYGAAGMMPPTYADHPLTAGTVVRTLHILQLRNALLAIE